MPIAAKIATDHTPQYLQAMADLSKLEKIKEQIPPNGSLCNQSDPCWHKPSSLEARFSPPGYYAPQSPQDLADCYEVDEFPPSSIRFQEAKVR